MSQTTASEISPKLILPAFVLCFFLGVFGAHRFYVGKVGTAILQILTVGGLGIWVLVDWIMIMVGAFRDKQGRVLKRWT
ncbi:TM2 domain-containing protein [Myceligenerans indicum]|nr:TM2 domain-containing protein [Myceligenerans indicum]